ncbi:IS4 family transposase [Legionella sainthelensi]|uniref:IS4 family transposase n=1 Tax=Legionella sainthelensi TaxID=28087 RepID=UPI000F709EC6|nr:IS4 family transposase [Legionella sainthelensi]VEH33817.1 transposase [Legionella sainthelensi]
MNEISELKLILKQQLNWHKSRIDFFAQALVGLFICRTINFREIAVSMPSETEIDSRYKRIYRFFSGYTFDFTSIARWLFYLFFTNNEKLYISIDRTNWFFGKAKINIFMLSVCYEGIAIPLFWTLLNKAGNTTAKEQIALISRFINLFGKERIQGVLADREFTNKTLIGWLIEENIPFYLRIKGNMDICIRRKKFKTSAQLFSHLQPFQQQVFGMRVHLFGQPLYLAGSKNSREELLIVVTNQHPKNAIACYLRRWEIESLFQSLKGRGFRFEETHVTQIIRIEKIIAFLAIAFAWAHKVGEWRAIRKAIPIKKIRKQKRPQYSFFRYGLDLIRDLITRPNYKNNKIKEFRHIINQLIPDPAWRTTP